MKCAADWHEQGRAVAELCRRFLPGLAGVYVHGSAALGGMNKASDLDILVITRSEEGAPELGAALLGAVGGPRALELSVVTTGAAAHPQSPWPFILHVNSAEDQCREGTAAGDPDLLAHYAVTGAAGIVLWGPEPAAIIGRIDREQLLDYLRSELLWGLDHGDQRYAVLNACRASAYRTTGRLLSKIDGAAWWEATYGSDTVVTHARQAQTAGTDLGPTTPEARTFVMDRIAELVRSR